MDLPEQERLDAMSAALARMVETQRALEARLERIETSLGLSPSSPSSTIIATPPPLPEVTSQPPEAMPPPLPQAVPTPEPAPTMETRFGLGWLNRVAVITLLFGIAFLFKYAVDNDWIGPGVRVALGLTAATLSLVLGEWISLRGQKIFAQGLTGLGLALLYLSFYASFGFYHLLPQSAAFLLMFLTTLGAAALAKHYDSQAVAILGLAGGYLTPVLLSTGENRLDILAAYSSLLNIGAVAMARVKRWTALEYLAFAGTWLLFQGWSASYLDNDTRRGALAWLTASFVVFFVASVVRARLWLLALNAGVYFAAAYFVLDPQFHAALGAFAGALAVLHGAAAWIMREKDTRFGQLAAAIAVVFLTLAIPLQFASFRITILWSLEAAALAWIARTTQQSRFQMGAWVLFAFVFLRLSAADSGVFESSFFNGRLLTFAVAAVSLWIAARFADTEAARSIASAAGHLALLWGLGMEVSGWARRTAEPQDAANVSSTGISILMALYSSVLIGAGVALHSARNRLLGLSLMALVIAKLYLIDVWQLSRGFRITAFLALGGLLLLVSYLYSRFRPAIEKLWKVRPAEENQPV
jgi:uncharacterized membrane protein